MGGQQIFHTNAKAAEDARILVSALGSGARRLYRVVNHGPGTLTVIYNPPDGNAEKGNLLPGEAADFTTAFQIRVFLAAGEYACGGYELLS